MTTQKLEDANHVVMQHNADMNFLFWALSQAWFLGSHIIVNIVKKMDTTGKKEKENTSSHFL